jgi:hypothetical protein
MVTRPVWIAGDVLRYGGDFNKFITSKGIVKQEGIIFRHLLRFILLCQEFAQSVPDGIEADTWQAEMREIAEGITETCRGIDPDSTDKAIEAAQSLPDVVRGESGAATTSTVASVEAEVAEFGAGLDD